MTQNGSNGGKLLVIGLFVLSVLAVFGFLLLKNEEPKLQGEPSAQAMADSPTPSAAPGALPRRDAVRLLFVYSTEKKAWLEQAVAAFEAEHPGVDVELVGQGSMESVQAIVSGKQKPTLWSPADDTALELMSADWRNANPNDIVARSGPDVPEPLVLSPLVLVAWEERGKLLDPSGSGIDWKRLEEVISSDKGWPAVGGEADWGFVKLGHTDPTRSNSGLQMLVLIAYEVHNKRSGLVVGDVLDPKFQKFLKAFERGVPKFGDSTGTFMREMVLYGPSKYDIVVTYENLAIENIPHAQGRWGNLRVFYPRQTMWSSHPAVLLQAPWVTEEQKVAARSLLAFLRSRPSQEAALAHGFRPADPAVAILGAAQNPFKDAQAFGVKVDIPPVVEPPPAPVLHNLMELWSRTVAR